VDIPLNVPTFKNSIVVLTNNVVLIGATTKTDNGVLIQKPHSIQRSGEGFQIQQFLEMFTGQTWDEIEIKDEHILASTEAQKNELLTAYLQKISGIDLGNKQIIV